MKIALASDHAGYEQLKDLQEYLQALGHQCQNYGPQKLDPSDDYPDFVFKAADAVAKQICDLGIIIGGSGQGEAMAANRVKGIRCAVFYGPAVAKGSIDAEGNVSHDPYEIIKLSRAHNNANMLSLGGRFLSLEEIKRVVKLWLDTAFSGAQRHQRRNDKLDSL